MQPFGRLWGYAQWVNAYLADEVIAETAPCGAVRHGAECDLDGLVLDLFFASDFWCHTISFWRWTHGSRNLSTGWDWPSGCNLYFPQARVLAPEVGKKRPNSSKLHYSYQMQQVKDSNSMKFCYCVARVLVLYCLGVVV